MNRYKARLIAQGFTQTYSVNYLQTCPLWLVSTLFVLFLLVNHQWPMFQLDMKNVFLYSNLEVYMKQPPKYVAQGENMICKLKKAIYDLKQSPRA